MPSPCYQFFIQFSNHLSTYLLQTRCPLVPRPKFSVSKNIFHFLVCSHQQGWYWCRKSHQTEIRLKDYIAVKILCSVKKVKITPENCSIFGWHYCYGEVQVLGYTDVMLIWDKLCWQLQKTTKMNRLFCWWILLAAAIFVQRGEWSCEKKLVHLICGEGVG